MNKVLVVLVLLLSGAVVYLLVRGNQPAAPDEAREDTTPVINAGKEESRESVPKSVRLPPPSPPVSNPGSIRESLAPGHSYRVVQKAGLAARGEDPRWGAKEVVKIGLVAEFVFTRKIEVNDGNQLVEVRDYEAQRAVAFIIGAGDFQIELGPSDETVLDSVAALPPRKVTRIDNPGPVIDTVLRGDINKIKADPKTVVVGEPGSLAGKKVRLTSIDGKGVVAVEPVGCSLNAWERQYFFAKDPLIYSRLLLKLNFTPGATIQLPGWLFSEMLETFDPEPFPKVTGQVSVTRIADSKEKERRWASLTVNDASELRMEDSASDGKVIGTFRPVGELSYDLDDRYVRSAVLIGDFRLSAIPKGSPVSEASFVEEARLHLTYSCRKR